MNDVGWPTRLLSTCWGFAKDLAETAALCLQSGGKRQGIRQGKKIAAEEEEDVDCMLTQACFSRCLDSSNFSAVI